MLRKVGFWVGLSLLTGPVPAVAQSGEGVTIRSRAVEIRLSGRVHEQFNTTSADGEAASEFLILRARPELEVVVNDFIEGKLTVDFGEGEVDLKDAYLTLNFDPAFEVTLGQFKRPFDLFELTSSTQILVIERTGKIRGTEVSSLSRFTERLRYSDRDIGVRISGHDRRSVVKWAAAVTNGNGANAEDADGVKALQARVGVSPVDRLTVWGNLSATPFATETAGGRPDRQGDHDQAVAFQFDAEWGNFDRGLHIQAGIVGGDNWRRVEGTTADVPQFLAWQVMGTYKIPVQGKRFVGAVEPLLRVSQGNPDTDVADDGGILLTPGFVVHFVGRNKIALNLDVWNPEDDALDAEASFKAQAYLHF